MTKTLVATKGGRNIVFGIFHIDGSTSTRSALTGDLAYNASLREDEIAPLFAWRLGADKGTPLVFAPEYVK